MQSFVISIAQSQIAAAVALLLTLVGFPITLWGLILTYRQASRAGDAARAATDAVENFKLKMNRHSASRDITEAGYALETTRRHLKNEAWRDASDSYEDARRAIIRVQLASSELNPEQRDRLKKITERMRIVCNGIDTALAGKGAFPDRHKISIVIRKNYELLASIQIEMEKGLA